MCIRDRGMAMAKKIVFEIMADSDCTTIKTWKKSFLQIRHYPVSYTHLDVYKRQTYVIHKFYLKIHETSGKFYLETQKYNKIKHLRLTKYYYN